DALELERAGQSAVLGRQVVRGLLPVAAVVLLAAAEGLLDLRDDERRADQRDHDRDAEGDHDRDVARVHLAGRAMSVVSVGVVAVGVVSHELSSGDGSGRKLPRAAVFENAVRPAGYWLGDARSARALSTADARARWTSGAWSFSHLLQSSSMNEASADL